MSEYENYCEKNLCLYSKTVPLFTHDEDKRPHKKKHILKVFLTKMGNDLHISIV
jgi:hypothetical protein